MNEAKDSNRSGTESAAPPSVRSIEWLDALRESYARISWRHSDGDKHGNHHIPDTDLKALQKAIERTLESASNAELSDRASKT